MTLKEDLLGVSSAGPTAHSGAALLPAGKEHRPQEKASPDGTHQPGSSARQSPRVRLSDFTSTLAHTG